MYIKIRGTKPGIFGEGKFIINTDNIQSIEVFADSKVLNLVNDPKGIMINNDDFPKLEALLDIKDCTI